MAGDQLGIWTLDRKLGRGGMGTVYLAHTETPPPGRPPEAAIKVLAGELAVEEGFLLRFQREIEVLAQLDHPNIVHFYESGVDQGRYYYAMEYVDGPSFESLLTDQGPLSWPEVLDLGLQVCVALKHAHDRGIIHRDLKPSNLLRAGAPQADRSFAVVKLTDFGIAQAFARPHLTATGGIIGTAEYLSPEQAAGKPVTKRSDLYSLGVVMYTLLSGRTPFEGPTVVDLLHKHQFGRFEQLGRLVPELPYELNAIVGQLLEKDPANRPGDAMVLHRQLDSLRRKQERIESAVTMHPLPDLVPAGPPKLRPGEGPATLMSRLMREELDRQNYGGRLRRFFNHPVVLVALLAVTVGLIVWGLRPPSEESLFQRADRIMASANPDDWSSAEDDLRQYQERYPDGPHREQVEEFRRRIAGHRAHLQAAHAPLVPGPLTEAQWFYYEGLRARQRGQEGEARRLWGELVRAFGDVPAEKQWVRLAGLALKEPAKDCRSWDSVDQALERARKLREDHQEQAAEAVYDSLIDLYRDDTSAADIRERIRKERQLASDSPRRPG